jgi:hypothetical protein
LLARKLIAACHLRVLILEQDDRGSPRLLGVLLPAKADPFQAAFLFSKLQGEAFPFIINLS